MRIIVVGGGISGLSAAWAAVRAARQANQKIQVVVLESANSVGGKAITVKDGEWRYETGPIGFMDNEPSLNEMIADIGLGSRAIAASDAAARIETMATRGAPRDALERECEQLDAALQAAQGELRALADS